jgi:hypothetical protein
VAIGLFGGRRGGRRSGGSGSRGSRRRRGSPRGRGRGRLGGGCRLRLRRRIDPAGMNPSAQAIRNFGVDRAEEPDQASKRRLDVAARTAKAVVQIEVAKRGIEIVAPHQNHHPAAEPDAFGVSGRTIDGLRRLDEFVGLALVVLAGIGGGRGRICCRRLAGLILGAKVAALGKGASNTEQQCKPGDGEVAQNRKFKLKHPSTHKFPDCFLPAASRTRWCDAVQIGPQCGGDA